MLWVCKYGFYRDREKKKSRYGKRASFQMPSLILQKNCISLEKTSKFWHQDLPAAKAREVPWNEIASFVKTTKEVQGRAQSIGCENGENGNISYVMTKSRAQRTSDLFVFNQGHHTGPLKECKSLGHVTTVGIITIIIRPALQVCVKNCVKAKD